MDNYCQLSCGTCNAGSYTVVVVGILLGMVQAATSINEATLSFVPKLIVVGAMLALFGGSILYLIADFTIDTFNRIPELLV